MRSFIYAVLTVAACAFCVSSAAADVKIKAKMTMAGQSYDTTTFIKGKRQRTESMNGKSISLTQCDLRRGIQLNSDTKTYMVSPFATTTETVTKPAAATANTPVETGGLVTTTITTKDTGERKQMFGFTARHLIVTMETVSSPDACNKTKSKMQTDGWYIDAAFVLDCDYASGGFNYNSGKQGGCRDRYQTKTVGAAKPGYPVLQKTTMFDESGNETYSMTTEVVELSKATLDAALFDVPADYREVKDASQLYAASSMSSAPSYSTDASTSSTAQNIRNAAAKTAGSETAATLGKKKAGVVRIGIADVKTGAVGDGISAADLSAAIRNSLAQYLKMPNVEVVTLESKLSSAIASEAAEKECDFIVNATASHKKGGGGFGMFGKALGSSIGAVGIGHTGSTVGNIVGQVATQTIVAATVSSNVKAKDQITLDLRLDRVNGQSALATSYKAKAKSDGDDIISQVVEQAAEAIAGTIKGS